MRCSDFPSAQAEDIASQSSLGRSALPGSAPILRGRRTPLLCQ